MQYQGILIRYGELVLKGKNRIFFTNKLKKNIETILQTKVARAYDRMFIQYQEAYLEKLKFIPGISSFSPYLETPKTYDNIEKAALSFFNNETKTFRISARRNDKSFALNSQTLNIKIGSQIQKVYKTAIDLKNPEINLIIEVRKDLVFLMKDTYQGMNGIPANTAGKILNLLSGGFDSPVAAIELMKRGAHISNIAFITPPHTDQTTIDKLIALQSVFKKVQGHASMILINYSDLMNYLSLVSNQSYKVVLMRRSFYRIAQRLAQKFGFQALSTGENLSQVSSQTLESLETIAAVTKMLVLRPLTTFNKNDILNLATKYHTHQICIIKASESCELFAPENPVIKPSIKVAQKLEKELDEITKFEDEIVAQAELVWY